LILSRHSLLRSRLAYPFALNFPSRTYNIFAQDVCSSCFYFCFLTAEPCSYR
jgi:hypothetical protein